MLLGNVTWGDVATEILLPENVAFHFRVKSAKFVPVKEGQELNKDGQPNYPYINVDLVVKSEGEFLGQHIFDNFTMKPGQMFMLRQLAEKTGLDLEEMAQQAFDPNVYVDREGLMLLKKQEAKDGYPAKMRVKKFLSFGEVEADE